MPRHWLFKSEPDSFSIDDLQRVDHEEWSGVRSFQARNLMREMKLGDLGFFYHTGEEKQIVGIVEVIREHYPDPTDETQKFVVVDVKAVEPFAKPVTLADIKADKRFKDMVLVKQSRLSVQPVTAEEWKQICRLGGVKGG